MKKRLIIEGEWIPNTLFTLETMLKAHASIRKLLADKQIRIWIEDVKEEKDSNSKCVCYSCQGSK